MTAVKAKLEAILTEELSELMNAYVAAARDENFELERDTERDLVSAAHHCRGAASNYTELFGSGCGTSAAPAFSRAFLGVLQQSEVQTLLVHLSCFPIH